MPVPISGDGFSRRYSVVAETRRRWSEEEKRAILAEALEPRAKVSAVARRHGLNPGLLFRWLRMARDGGKAQAPRPAFLPVAVAAAGAKGASRNRDRGSNEANGAAPSDKAQNQADSRIEIELENGRRVWVSAGTDTGLLIRILDLLERR